MYPVSLSTGMTLTRLRSGIPRSNILGLKMATASATHEVGILALLHRIGYFHKDEFFNYLEFTFDCKSTEKATTGPDPIGSATASGLSHALYELANPKWVDGYPKYECGGGSGKVSVQTRVWLAPSLLIGLILGEAAGHDILESLKTTVTVTYDCKCDTSCK